MRLLSTSALALALSVLATLPPATGSAQATKAAPTS